MSSNLANNVITSVRIVGKDIFSKTSGKIIAGAYGTEDSTEAGHETAGKDAEDEGMVCGGMVDVLLEIL